MRTTFLKNNGETNVVLNENGQLFKICVPDRKRETNIIRVYPRLLLDGFQAVEEKWHGNLAWKINEKDWEVQLRL